MNRLVVLILAVAFSMLCCGCPSEKESIEKQPGSEHKDWVHECLRDFESIKPGMTRHEVEQRFPMDGGLQGVSPVRFTHPRCMYFKVDVYFLFERNQNDQGRAIWGQNDRVTTVSKPYIERPFMD